MYDKGLLKFPGMQKFARIFDALNQIAMISDRTGAIKTPIHTEDLDPIPALESMKYTYEELCDMRAKEILEMSQKRNIKLYVFYSGGIDSTLILVSLLKNCTQQQKERIVVCMSEESILENPNFYRDYIIGKLKVESSHNFKYLLGTDNLLVTGYHNDQLFGMVSTKEFMDIFGDKVIHEKYNKDLISRYYNMKLNDLDLSKQFTDILEKTYLACPVKLETNFDYFWWLTFALRWDGIYHRILLFTSKKNLHKITREYLKENYISFYGTKNFQLWSMYNLDKKIKEDWASYKYICKEIIYDFNKDEDYFKNKLKSTSFNKVTKSNSSLNYIVTPFEMVEDINFEDYYNPDNDFT